MGRLIGVAGRLAAAQRRLVDLAARVGAEIEEINVAASGDPVDPPAAAEPLPIAVAAIKDLRTAAFRTRNARDDARSARVFIDGAIHGLRLILLGKREQLKANPNRLSLMTDIDLITTCLTDLQAMTDPDAVYVLLQADLEEYVDRIIAATS